MKKLFGELNLSWKKIILSAIIIGIIVGLLNCVPALFDTSFRDPAIYFTLWILIGILIIMNSKSNKESALKCFVFFLISQPIIYLVEVPFNKLGWGIFVYYKWWFIWTLLTLPMGFIGYYMKKNKWWGLLILLPMMGLLTEEIAGYLSGFIYSFPHHILSYVFGCCSLIIYPLFIFDNKKIKVVGTIIGILCILVASSITIFNKPTYETDIICSKEEHPFDDTYKVSMDKQYGNIFIKKYEIKDENGNDDSFFCVHTEFVKTGKTEVTLESSDGNKEVYDLIIGNNTYDIEKRESDNLKTLKIIINNDEYELELENNDTTKELIKLLPKDYQMKELNGNEKYVYIDESLPTNSSNPGEINKGDVMLYGDNCIVIFYKSFKTNYNYTKIGHINNLPDFDKKDITVKFERE